MLGSSRYITQTLKTVTFFKGYPLFVKKYFLINKLIYQNYCTNPLKKVEFDYEYLCNKDNTKNIKDNISRRKSNGNIDKVISLWETLKQKQYNPSEKQLLEDQLYTETLKIPNKSSPHLYEYGETPFVLKTYNDKPSFSFNPKEFHNLMQANYFLIIDDYLQTIAGSRSYVFTSSLANLERALIRYCIDYLLKKGFLLISVPDLLYSHVIERCGMQTKGKRAQVYHLSNFGKEEPVCLSGTAEMAIGGYLQDRKIHIKDLPLKIAALSRCYRQEVGRLSIEKGIYRVHQFNKVEMFGVTANETGDESKEFYEELIKIQTELYASLDFHFQLLDMPLNDLGDQAYAKTDIEAWIPVKNFYGEISSTSNCLDYQSRRLNLRYENEAGEVKFAHTLNGTACAAPRMLMAIVASNQTKKSILIPKALQPFYGSETITKVKHPLLVNHFRNKTYGGIILKSTDELEADFV